MVDEEQKAGLEAVAPSGVSAESERPKVHKAAGAFRTISEVADELHVPQHVLRFWESKFPQVRPLKRGGGRRYYRPEDVLLLRRVADLLYTQGYTIKGVQRLLRDNIGAVSLPYPPEEKEADSVAPQLPAEPEMPEVLEAASEPFENAEESVLEPVLVIEEVSEPTILMIDPPIIDQAFFDQPEETSLVMPVDELGSTAPEPDDARQDDAEIQYLRSALAETLAALEDLRRMLD